MKISITINSDSQGNRREISLEINKKDELSDHILKAIIHSDYDLVVELLKLVDKEKMQFSRPWQTLSNPSTGNYAIHEAIINSDGKMLALLIHHQVNLNSRNKDGQTALDLALEEDDHDLAIQLLQAPGIYCSGLSLYQIYKSENPALQKAALALPELQTGIWDLWETHYNNQEKLQFLSDWEDLRQKYVHPLADEKVECKEEKSDLPSCLFEPDVKPLTPFERELNTYYHTIRSQTWVIPNHLTPAKKKLWDLLTACRMRVEREVDKLGIYQKFDFYLLALLLYRAITQYENVDQLKLEIQNILGSREDAVLDSELDYPNDHNSPANELCYNIAQILKTKEESPYNVLLKRARTLDRDHDWEDYITNKTQLPSESKDFFRLRGNEIHLYELVVTNAIVRLKDGHKRLEHVWFGTDPKNIRPAPPLNRKTLELLKQRSTTLKLLIHYTDLLDQESRGANDIFSQLVNLSNGLHAGSYTVTRDHKNAGAASNVAEAEFADWWNGLNPELQTKIRKIRANNYGKSIGEVLDIILSVEDIEKGNKKRFDDIRYCVHLRQRELSEILDNPQVEIELKALTPPKPSLYKVDNQILEAWEKQILKELTQPRPIHNPEKGGFPDLSTQGQLNLLLLPQFNNYQAMFAASAPIERNIRTLIQYIFAQTDNAKLENLRKILNSARYDFLRTRGRKEKGHFFALIKGQRRLTNPHYSQLERALSLQMVKNEVAQVQSKAEASLALKQLCQRHPFIANNRTHPFNWLISLASRFVNWFNSKTSRLFSGLSGLHSGRVYLDRETQKIKKELFWSSGDLEGLLHQRKGVDFALNLEGLAKEKGIQRIISLVYAQKDNGILQKLSRILNKEEYDYLRESESFSNSYALIRGQRVTCNPEFARLEKALALQMVKNVTSGKKDEAQALGAVRELQQTNPFIKNCRKGPFNLFASNTATLFNGRRRLVTSRNRLENEIIGLRMAN